MSIGQTPSGIRIVKETLKASEIAIPLYQVVAAAGEHSNQITVEYNNFAKGRNKPQIFCADQQAVFVQLVSPARFGATHVHSQRLIPMATIALQKWFRDIRFLTTARDEVLVELLETFGNIDHGCEAALLSDGTLRVIAVAAALLSVAEGSLVVIEEIDNGVHPSRAAMLLRGIRDVAARRKLRVLLTTHNPALLDALPPSSLADVTVCYRSSAGDSKLVRLRDLDRYTSIVAEGTLGALVTHGVIDRYVKAPPIDAAVARKRALEWIDSMMSGSEEP